MLGRAVRVKSGDPAVDNGRHADLAGGFHRQRVQQLKAGQIADHPARCEAVAGREHARFDDVKPPKPAQLSVGHINHLIIRRESDPIGRDHMPFLLADVGTVGPGVVDRAVLAAFRRRAAVVGEPEAACLVEHQVVGPDQPPAVTAVIDGLQLAAGHVIALDHAAHMAGRRRAGDGQAAIVQPLKCAAIVGDPDGAVRADRRAIRAASGLDHRLLAAIRQDARQPLRLDLGQDHRTIRHGDRAFGKFKALGDKLDVHGGGLPGAFVVLSGAVAA